MAAPTIAVQMEFAGLGAGWTSVTTDVVQHQHIRVRYGMPGWRPTDRVASTGMMRFALDNSSHNSAALLGYYSPNHANCRSGFGLGIRVRLALTFSGTTYYKFLGSLEAITPVPGVKRERVTHCLAVDWMDEAARFLITGVATQLNKRSDQVFSTILATIPRQPQSTTIATGNDVFPYSVDNSRDEKMSAMAEFQRIAQSELGYIYVKGDTTAGGRLVFEDRHTRIASSVNAATFNESMVEMGVGRTRAEVYNKVQIVAHPRRVDTSNVVLYSLQATPDVAPGETVIILGPYRDPNQKAARVGGTSMVAPVSGTDYAMNSLATGAGTNLTANFTLTANLGSNGVRFTITNNGGTTGFLTLLQVRGLGLYDFEHAISEATDATSQSNYGQNPISLDMFYQSDVGFTADVANYILNLYKDPLTYVSSITLFANTSDALMVQALAREISDRIGIVETVTGVSTASNRGYYIQAVDLDIGPGAVLNANWLLTPADTSQYWILDQVGASELDISTRLGL